MHAKKFARVILLDESLYIYPFAKIAAKVPYVFHIWQTVKIWPEEEASSAEELFSSPITIPKKKERGFAKKKNRAKPKEKPGWTAGQTKLMMEHLAGIEPVYPAWEAGVLPLNYRCIGL